MCRFFSSAVVRPSSFWPTIAAIFTIQLKPALPVRMLTTSQELVADPGDLLRLDCEFHAADLEDFNLFDNPISWRKTQLLEEIQINMMGNILDPFVPQQRFQVSYRRKPSDSRHLLTLIIYNVTAEDSANYTCVVHGPHNILLGSVVHSVQVRVPAHKVELQPLTDSYIARSSASSASSSASSADDVPTFLTVSLTEHQPSGPLGCVCLGGYPAPSMSIHIGSRDVTDQFPMTSRLSVNGTRGFRLITYVTSRETTTFYPRPADDGQNLTCTVAVLGLPPITAQARIMVSYGPIINCFNSIASVADVNVRLICEVKAKPDVTSLFWIVDVNKTTVDDDEGGSDYGNLVRVRSDGILEVQLHIRQVTVDSFRTYTIVAENDVAVRKKTVRLVQKHFQISTPKFSNRQKYSYSSSNKTLSSNAGMQTEHASPVAMTSGCRSTNPCATSQINIRSIIIFNLCTAAAFLQIVYRL